MQSWALRTWKVVTYRFTQGPKPQVPSPHYDMDAYIRTLVPLLHGEAWDLC